MLTRSVQGAADAAEIARLKAAQNEKEPELNARHEKLEGAKQQAQICANLFFDMPFPV